MTKITPANEDFSKPFTVDEVNIGINKIKTGKAAGEDSIFPEFLKKCGTSTREWLAKFYSDILETGKLPSIFKRARVIAIPKPGKPINNAESYRPISLLCVSYKLFERLISNRIAPVIHQLIPPVQAGFQPERSCADQVLALTTHIECGFQKGLKTSAAFVDLSAAYDTVWRKGLLFKLINAIPCINIYTVIRNMLQDRLFRVHLNNHASKLRHLNNGLPQGSVLAPLLFNLYMHDLPATSSKKFIYADDIALATQSKRFENAEKVLTEDLDILNGYFKRWRLCPNPTKTEVTCFHLSNGKANIPLSVSFNGTTVQHNPNPKYLGVTLDRSLTYRKHLETTAAKIQTRNNILQKLAGTSWGASADTIRTAGIALVYSVAEYCSPVWLNSSHSNKIDTQLNSTMRMVTGAVKSTPREFLPVLSHIAPPNLRRRQALQNLHLKIENNRTLPIHEDLNNLPRGRLKSRNAPYMLFNENLNIKQAWADEWHTFQANGVVDNLSVLEKPAGFNLPRHLWCKLNRVRTGHGRCKSLLYKWGYTDDARCECGEEYQTMKHIVFECPIHRYTGNPDDLSIVTPNVIEWLNGLNVIL